MEKAFTYLGIDISKETFDVAFLKNGTYVYGKLANQAKGFQGLVEWIDNQTRGAVCCVMEASGPYYLKLAYWLVEAGLGVSVVNPLVIRRYSQMRLMRAKTDKKDATIIAQYGHSQQPALWQKEEPYLLQLKQMQAYCDQLEKSRTGFIRQRQAFEVNPVVSEVVLQSLTIQIECLQAQLKWIEKEMAQLLQAHHQQQVEQLQSIPGIGPKTAMALIVLSGGFTKFENAKQLSSYVGLSPRIFESGTSVKGKARICKMGMSRIRALLYVCSWSAIKKNTACRQLYERLVEKGKAKKLALVAVANKLLKQAFALATHQTFYQEINSTIL